MEKSFRDRVLGFYRRTVYKHRWLKIPMMILSVILLSVDHFFVKIGENSRRILGVAFTFCFAFMSCSFTGAIFSNTEADFIAESSDSRAATEDSSATLVAEADLDESSVVISGDGSYEELEDDSSEETFLGQDIVQNVDLSGSESEDSDEDGEFDRSDWKLILINKQHPIPDDYTFTLGNLTSGMQCDERVIPDLYQMIEAALKDGVNLRISSPYRAASRQEMLFNKKINLYTSQGMSYMEAYRLAAQAVTIPGCSEHQVGLAFDITCDNYSSLNEGFGSTSAGIWLAEHCAEYGFIVRYPAGKENVTGIEYEPWHFRYVGRNAAGIIMNENITLEEFWENYL